MAGAGISFDDGRWWSLVGVGVASVPGGVICDMGVMGDILQAYQPF